MLDVSSPTGQISRRRTMENLDPIRPGVSTAAGDLDDAAYPRPSALIAKSIQSDSPTDPEHDTASFPLLQNRRGHKRQPPVI